jgi:hypothetical protein
MMLFPFYAPVALARLRGFVGVVFSLFDFGMLLPALAGAGAWLFGILTTGQYTSSSSSTAKRWRLEAHEFPDMFKIAS